SGKVIGTHGVTLGEATPPNPVAGFPREEGVRVIVPRHHGPFSGWVCFAVVDGRDIETGEPLGSPSAHRMLNSSSTVIDAEYGMNPAHIVYEALTNPEWGLGYPPAVLDLASFTAAADT